MVVEIQEKRTMTDFIIPCDTFGRIASVIENFPPDGDPNFKYVRIEDGFALASDRKFMAIEKIVGGAGIIHIVSDPTLIAQCRTEAKFSSVLTITVNEALRFVVAKTTLGYVHSANIGYWPVGKTDLDRWREVVDMTKTPVKKGKGGMFWDCAAIARLAAASPSGRVIFEENIDNQRPTIMRDVHDYNWVGIFNPYSNQEAGTLTPATLPSWIAR
jgi:hypothetical protein